MRRERVLIVDDDLSMRQMVSILLKRTGYSVEAVASAEEALAAIENDWPDLVITDLNMPGMNGIELLVEIKALAAQSERDVEVIVVTAYGSTRTAVDAMTKGAANYVLKPFNNDELRVVVRRAIGRKALLGARIGRFDDLRVVEIVLGIHAIEEDHAGVGMVVGRSHDLVHQLASR